MRVRDEVLGSWKGARGGRENYGGIRVTGGRVWVTGWEGKEKGEVREGASGLPDVGSAGTGGDGMICPPAVRTVLGPLPLVTSAPIASAPNPH